MKNIGRFTGATAETTHRQDFEVTFIGHFQNDMYLKKHETAGTNLNGKRE